MAEITITAKNFDQEVLASDKPVLVDFWAAWCAPCRMLAPIIQEIAESRSDIKVGKINVDDEGELAARYGITSIPTVMLFIGGNIAAELTGYHPRFDIEALIG